MIQEISLQTVWIQVRRNVLLGPHLGPNCLTLKILMK